MEHMDHQHTNESIAAHPAEPAAMRERCDGTLDPGGYGSWQGHMLPGLIFVIWGTWMAYGAFKLYLASSVVSSGPKGRAVRKPYTARVWHKAPWRSAALLEPIFKLVLVCLGLLTELRLDHSEYVYVACQPHKGSFCKVG